MKKKKCLINSEIRIVDDPIMKLWKCIIENIYILNIIYKLW